MTDAEKRACKELAAFAADGFFQVQPDAIDRNARHVKRLAAAFEEVSRDGHAAGFAEAKQMAAQTAASYEPQHEMNTSIARSVARNIAAAIRSLAAAPTGEKEG